MNRHLTALSALSACSEGYAWAVEQGDIPFTELWARCPRADWITWLGRQLAYSTPSMGLDICRRGMTLVIESVRRGEFKTEEHTDIEELFRAVEADMPRWTTERWPNLYAAFVRAKHGAMGVEHTTTEYHIYKTLVALHTGSWDVRATEFLAFASDLSTPNAWGKPVDTPFARALADIVRSQFDVEVIEKKLVKSVKG
jgi:hypothetical protein